MLYNDWAFTLRTSRVKFSTSWLKCICTGLIIHRTLILVTLCRIHCLKLRARREGSRSSFRKEQIVKISFRSISTDTVQFCLCNAYPRSQAVEHENASEISLLIFPMQTQVCLIGENRNSLEYFILDRTLRSTSVLVLQFTVGILFLTAQLGLGHALDAVTCHLQVASLYWFSQRMSATKITAGQTTCL